MAELRDTFITGTGVFLPGEPTPNDRIEDFIGRIGGRPSILDRKALQWNGIETRHYALSPSGEALFSNASMSADAVRASLDDAGLGRGDLEFLATATTQGDYIVPGHASAVHGELGGGPLEIASFQSVCASSVMAAKAAWLAVRCREADCAAAVASEFSSRWFRPSFYEGTALVDAKGRLALEADFLRWTLSDGAGAAVMEPAPRGQGASLRVDWIDLVSLAGRFDRAASCGGGDAPERSGVHSDITTLDRLNGGIRMLRLWSALALAALVAACTGSSYTVEGVNIDSANERAARYCSNGEATAQLERVHQRGGSSVETYRCVAAK